MRWITRERPKIDRIACPWLIKRFIDKEAEIIYVPAQDVKTKAKKLKATPFDIPDVEYTHYGDKCTFDYFIEKHKLKDKALFTIANIVRGADTDRHEIAAESSGLWAISAGLSENIQDDNTLLKQGMVIYDALYTWAKNLQHIKHTQNPYEKMLIDVYQKFIHKKTKKGIKIPVWVNELKETIQDQIDTNLNLSLSELSKTLNKNPAYLSREFAKYFEDLSFGEYIRKLRVDKAIWLLNTSEYSLSEIAYLTGFSDQSHFTRIFKKHTGKNPLAYRKDKQKSKTNTKS